MSEKVDNRAKSKQKDWNKVLEQADDSSDSLEHSKTANKLEHPDYKELEAKLTEAEQQAEQYKNETLRSYAEMENVRRRLERDVANAHKFGLDKLIKELLPVMDSIEHGIANCEKDSELMGNIHDGLVLTQGMFLKSIEKFGVEQVDPLGEKFNPELHEAMSIFDDPKAAAGTVLQVMQKGYLLNGRLLRPALVIVAK